MLEKVVGEFLGCGCLHRQNFLRNFNQKMLDKVFGEHLRRGILCGCLRHQKFSKKLQPENVRKGRWRICSPRKSSRANFSKKTPARKCQKKSLEKILAEDILRNQNFHRNLNQKMLEKVVGRNLGRGCLRCEKFCKTSTRKCQKKSLKNSFAEDFFAAKNFLKLQPENVKKSRWRISSPRNSQRVSSPPKIFKETSTIKCQKRSLENMFAE